MEKIPRNCKKHVFSFKFWISQSLIRFYSLSHNFVCTTFLSNGHAGSVRIGACRLSFQPFIAIIWSSDSRKLRIDSTFWISAEKWEDEKKKQKFRFLEKKKLKTWNFEPKRKFEKFYCFKKIYWLFREKLSNQSSKRVYIEKNYKF